MDIDWLNSPLVCDGRIVRLAISPNTASDTDLPEICWRMHVIMDSIEFARCEGRLLPADLFDAIDTLENNLTLERDDHLNDWLDTIQAFGQYYGLAGAKQIVVTRRSIEDHLSMADRLGIDPREPFSS